EDETNSVGQLVPSSAAIKPVDLLLAKSLRTRHTARTAHIRRPLPLAVLTVLQEEARRSGCVLYVTTERGQIRQLAKLARQATVAQFANTEVQGELWHWLRLDSGDPDYQRDGLSADCMNLRGIALTIARLLRAVCIDRRSVDPQGGRIVRDRNGEPTGELLETAVGRVEALARTAAAGTGYEDWLAALADYCQGLFAAGITHICDPGIDAMLEGYLRRAQREGRLPLPVSMLFVSGGGLFQPPADRMAGSAVTGDELDGLPVGALKLFADGGSRCAVCVGMLESFAGVVGLVGRAAKLRRPALLAAASTPERPHIDMHGHVSMGFLHYQREQLAALCADAHKRGFQLAVHAPAIPLSRMF
ncbi:MAG: amidohydrolase family protein, partial [Chloroflexota bacterium]|nr:amidohydrolase family protein [Chloroflexota bacterium]